MANLIVVFLYLCFAIHNWTHICLETGLLFTPKSRMSLKMVVSVFIGHLQSVKFKYRIHSSHRNGDPYIRSGKLNRVYIESTFFFYAIFDFNSWNASNHIQAETLN